MEKRDKAGRPSKWNHTQTKAMRMPTVFEDVLYAVARRLDSGEVSADELRLLIEEENKC